MVNIGEAVALNMQHIIKSDDHQRTFFKNASVEKCCVCKDKCTKDCACKGKCKNDCSDCNSEMASHAMNNIINLLSKVSEDLENFGLKKSSISALKTLESVVEELNKKAEIDVNDISWEELVKDLKKDNETRKDFKRTYDEDPDVIELLKKRINESETDIPFVLSEPSNLFKERENLGGSLTDLDDSTPTDLAPYSLRNVEIPKTENRYLKDLIDENNFDYPLNNEETSLSQKETKTVIPNKPEMSVEAKRKNIIEKKSFNDEVTEEELDQNFSDITVDKSFTDDEEFEDENEEPENRDHGFGYEEETYPDLDPENPWTYHPPKEKIRLPGGEYISREDMSPEERLDMDSRTGLSELLDVDPDELTDEDVPGNNDWMDEYLQDDDYDQLPENKTINEIRKKHREDFLDDPDETSLKNKNFWND